MIEYTKLSSIILLIFFTGCSSSSKKTIEAGATLYKSKCAECHGVDGTNKALGRTVILNGQSQEEIEIALKAYKAGTRNVAGMGAWKQGLLTPLSDADIDAVSAYISTL